MTETATVSGSAGAGPLGPDHGYGPDIDHVLLSEEQIQSKIAELAAQVAADYTGREILLIGVLKGAVMFMSDFARALQLPTQMEFMAVSSYGSATSSSGIVRILKDLDRDITGKHVLVVEDIVDSGLTLSWLLRNLQAVHLAAVDALLTRWRGQGRADLTGGSGVVRASGRLTVQRGPHRVTRPSVDPREEP